MAPKPNTVGGGHAKGLSNDFFDFLQRGLNTGTFGAGQRGNPINDTKGIAGILNQLLAGGAGKFGGDLGAMIERQNSNNVSDIRARYGAGGGMGYGTPAAQAEAGYRAQHAADTGVAIGGLQLQALQSLFPLYQQGAQLGTPQAQTVMEQNPWAAALGAIAPVASTVLPFLKGSPFGGAGATAGALPAASGVNYPNVGESGYFDFGADIPNR